MQKIIGKIMGVEMMPRSKSYKADLLQRLADPVYTQEYLNAALEDEDYEVFLLALRDVADAQVGGMTNLTSMTQLNRENLYRMLSQKGNPELKSLSTILSALGFRLGIEQEESAMPQGS
jgi:probable addiction module antidote protein